MKNRHKVQPSAVQAEQGLADIYNGACVVRFLNAIQLLRGCDYSNDQRIRRGDVLIRQFAAAHLLGAGPYVKLTTKDAADVLYLLHNIEPLDGENVFDGGKEHVGFTQILTWVEQSLRKPKR